MALDVVKLSASFFNLRLLHLRKVDVLTILNVDQQGSIVDGGFVVIAYVTIVTSGISETIR